MSNCDKNILLSNEEASTVTSRNDFRFVVTKREVLLRAAELEGPWLRERDDVEEEELVELKGSGVGQRRLYETHDIWAEGKLDDDWAVAYRVGLDDHDQPVIAEIRLFPCETWRPNHYEGRWSAEVLGSRAGAPSGGIKQKQIRAIPTRHHASVLQRAMSYFQKGHLSLLGRATLGRNESPFQSDAGPTRGSIHQPKKSGKRGRPPLPDAEYVEAAASYANAIARSSRSPAKDVARELRQDEDRTRAMLRRARARGLLSPALSPGKHGGALTERGKAVLRRERQRARREKARRKRAARGKR